MRSKRFLSSALFFLAAASVFSFVACDGNIVLDNGSCDAGKKSCDGVCADVKSDADNCGACGVVCDTGVACVNSKCGGDTGGSGGSAPCASLPGTSSCPDGCFDLYSDPLHCGACDTACDQNEICEGQCLGEGCVTCAGYAEGANPCSTETVGLYDALIECTCAGACIAVCQDNVCAGQTATADCQSCVIDTMNGCGVAFQACSNDI